MDWFRRLREWRKYVALIDGQKRLVASRPQRVSDITSRRLGYDDVEFVIVTKNSAGTLLGTINNLRGLYPGCSIMVVDGGSKDDTVEIGKQSGCRVFEGKWNVGAARNLSLSASTRRFLAHVDSDVQLGWGWLELVKPHFEDVGVVAVSGVTLYGFETDEALMAYCLQSGLIGVASFTNTLLDREKILKLGGIGDVQCGEDWEIYDKIIRNGYKWNLASDAYAYHRRYFWQQLKAYFNWSRWWRRTKLTSTHTIVVAFIFSPFVELLLGLKLHRRLTFYHPLLRLAVLAGWLLG